MNIKDNIKFIIQFNSKEYNNIKKIKNKNIFCSKVKYFFPELNSSGAILAKIIPIINPRKTTITDNE